jgi:ABC-type amino acid transport substrate-binding protein
MNTKIDIKLAPFGRHMTMFKSSKDIDVVTSVYGENNLPGFKTKSHITYYNGVSYLAEKFGQKIQSLEDLKGKRVISFVGARKMFPELEKMIPNLKSYSENSNQEIHSKMLFNDRVDAVISDAVIFAHHTAELQRENQKLYRKPVKFQQIFTPTPFYLVFRSSEYRNKFNVCLEKLGSLHILDRLNIEYYNEMIINK